MPPHAGAPAQFPWAERSSNVEPHPLSERKRGAVIDRVRRAAHVKLPAVRTRLAAAAGFLLAAECAADLRTRRSDIDVSDAAVGAACRKEQFGLAKIVRENRGRESLCYGVVQEDGFVEIAIANDIKDGCERLLQDGAGLLRHLNQRRTHIISALRHALRRPRAARHGTAGSSGLLHRSLHRLEGGLPDERPDERTCL